MNFLVSAERGNRLDLIGYRQIVLALFIAVPTAGLAISAAYWRSAKGSLGDTLFMAAVLLVAGFYSYNVTRRKSFTAFCLMLYATLYLLFLLWSPELLPRFKMH